VSAKPSFFAELKRRHVYRVAVAYAVVGWLLIQFATQVFPVFSLPNWTSALIVLLVAIGFPIALILAWAFELTPDGIRRTEPAHSEDARPAEQTHRVGRLLDFIIIGVLGVMVIALLVDRFVLHKPSPAATVVSVVDKSIAVLPFASLSEDKANAYFAEGIQDEILTRLAKIRALKVISRTSTQHYASSPDNLQVIAKQLNVANILEGSVQKAGDAVHINVQLIRAETDEHLWAESYNRKLDDIFGVEGEVAGAVAEQLNAQLSGADQQALCKRPTENAEAYDLYLRGIVFLSRADEVVPNSKNASAALEKAVQLDPAFASAWAALARAHASYYWNTGGNTSEKEASRRAMETATRLAPDAHETLLAQGVYRYWMEADKDGAKEILARVHAMWPNDSQSVTFLASIARRQGHWNQSLDLWNQAIALDPRNLYVVINAAPTARAMRDWSAARRFIDRGLDVAPNDKGALTEQVALFQATGQIDEAQKILDRMEIAPGDLDATGVFAGNAILKRSYAPALARVTTLLASADKLDPALLGGFQNLLGICNGSQVITRRHIAATSRRERHCRLDSRSSQTINTICPSSRSPKRDSATGLRHWPISSALSSCCRHRSTHMKGQPLRIRAHVCRHVSVTRMPRLRGCNTCSQSPTQAH